MKVPLSLNHFNGRFRVTSNKKIEVVKDLEVPVFSSNFGNQNMQVVGHGTVPINIQFVSDIQAYNRMKGDSPVTFWNQLYSTKANCSHLYPNTNDLDIMYYDIEVITKGDGLFPKAETNPIVCIGYAFNEEEPEVIIDYNEDPEMYDKADREILTKFLNVIEERDPDIMVGYNSYSFDMPYIIKRCEELNLPWWKLYRIYNHGKSANKIPQVISMIKEFNQYKNKMVDSDYMGRIHYDIYSVDVLRDQLLTDLKDKKMKTLAKYCGAEDVVELESDIEDTQRLYMEERERLIEYQKSDVRQTRTICNRYLPIDISLAENLMVPLETIIGRSDGTPATIYALKEMYKHDVIVMDTNSNRYPQLYRLNAKFQGAIVGLEKSGFFEELHKFDFKNMYPSSMWTWNLGPDTTKIEQMKEYTGEYHFNRIKNSFSDILMIEFPDTRYNRQIVISINMKIKSINKKTIEKLWAERQHWKDEAKKHTPGSPAFLDAKTNDNAIKVILNSYYGLNGNTHSIGDLPIAIAVTALCRWTTQYVIELMGDAVVEIDTDGIITNRKVDAEEINQKIATRVKEMMDIDECRMIIEDEWGTKSVSGFLYKMKNYVLNVNGEFIKHGVSMKSSQRPLCYDRAINLCLEYMFEQKYTKQELIEKVLHIEDLPLSDFYVKKKLNKFRNEYIDLNSDSSELSKLLAQVKQHKGVELDKGDIVEYVHCIDPISGHKTAFITDVAKKENINYEKYRGWNKDVLRMFNLEETVETSDFTDLQKAEEHIEVTTESVKAILGLF